MTTASRPIGLAGVIAVATLLSWINGMRMPGILLPIVVVGALGLYNVHRRLRGTEPPDRAP